ncbi:MAG TPA: Fe-S biogenesis protein NfuA, partial [Moraxellaceae bacterium]|nr:Fe-S biogenesis protein NfuA [Moraxellaceae bacterium]
MADSNLLKITITENAQAYLRDLLSRQDSDGIGVRIFVENPGTPRAECCMAYCTRGEEQADDVRLDYDGFPAFIE